MMTDYVWYASYGSNLLKERFLCYIAGGQPEGSLDIEPGCRDNSLPLKDRQILIPHRLYFAKQARRWDDGGVAFIAQDCTENNVTLGRMYLITREQFLDVVSQENNNINVNLNLLDVKNNRNYDFENSWYGNVVYLGEEEGFPIFTFTHTWEIVDESYFAPSNPYLKTIISGIVQCYDLSDEEIATYLIKKNGVTGNYTEKDIIKISASCRK
jgi:hypothetical protein